MKVTVTGKQFDVGETLRSHVEATTSSIVERYFGKATEAHVVLTRERHLVNAEISVHASRGLSVQGSGESTDPYAAFDSAAERIDKRLRRHKRWLRSHHRTRESAATPLAADATDYVLSAEEIEGDDNAEGEAKPLVIAEMRTHIPLLSVSAAVARLDLADVPALLFRNSVRGNLNLVYRRGDGNIGWIDPDLAGDGRVRDAKAQ